MNLDSLKNTIYSLLVAFAISALPLLFIALVIHIIFAIPFVQSFLAAWVGGIAFEVYDGKKTMMTNFNESQSKKESVSTDDK